MLTPEQKAEGWKLHDGSDVCPIKDERTTFKFMQSSTLEQYDGCKAQLYIWSRIRAYRIIEAHGADAEPARPTPFPRDYSELVFDDAGWSQTIIVDGKRPEWLRDDDRCSFYTDAEEGWTGNLWDGKKVAIRVRRRKPKRETVTGWLCHVPAHVGATRVSYDLIDGKPDLSTLKIAEDS